MHDGNLVPIGGISPAHELAGGKVRDGRDELGAGYFLLKRETDGSVELIRAVEGQAVGGAAQLAKQQGDHGGIGAEVDVEVGDALAAAPVEKKCGLNEVSEVYCGSQVAACPQPCSECEAPERYQGTPQRGNGSTRTYLSNWRREHLEGATGLLDIFGIHQRLIDGPYPDPSDALASANQFPEFTSYKAMAGLWIRVYEVSEFQQGAPLWMGLTPAILRRERKITKEMIAGDSHSRSPPRPQRNSVSRDLHHEKGF